MKKYQCPCCGYYTFESDMGDGPLFEFCEVCGWQYDPAAHNKPDTLIGANNITLNEAKINFIKFGVYLPEYANKNEIRLPLKEELSENNHEKIKEEKQIVEYSVLEKNFCEKVVIDFEPCKNIDDVRSLLKNDLNSAEWNDKNPDELLKQIKELNPCKIYLRGMNLVSTDISKYMSQIADIFYKVADMYNNIRVYTWNVITIDFTGVKSVYEAHKLISEKLNFPEWYGGNLDALWDLLTGYIPSYEIHLKGINEVHENLHPALQKIVNTFQEAEAKYDYHKIIVE